MSETRAKWDEVGTKLSGLGLKLKLHFEQARSEDEDQELKAAFRRLADAVEDAFSAVGDAAKDPAVTEDVKDVGRSLTDAMSATFADVSDEVRQAFNKRPS